MADDQQAGDSPDRAPQNDARDDRPGDDRPPRNDGKADGKADGDAGSSDSDTSEKDKEKEKEREREQERELAAGRFKEFTRDPLSEEQDDDGPTDLGAAERTRRATRTLFATGRDHNSFQHSTIRSAHIGDIHVRMDARQSGTRMRSGPVPEEELRRLRRIHVEPEGYLRLRKALTARRLLVLGAAPGTGRTSTALSLLDEVTKQVTTPTTAAGADPAPGPRVERVDPVGGVRRLADSLAAESAEDQEGRDGGEGRGARPATGYLLELPLTEPGSLPPDAMDLDGLAAALDARGSFAVVVVTVGSAANPLLAGRYGMLCPPAPTQELLTTRLRERLEEHVAEAPDGSPRLDELLARAEELADRSEIRDAVGLNDLRPAEAELFASLLAGHLLEDISHEELLSGCRSLAAGQAQEWFAGVDRALTAALPAGTDTLTATGTRGSAARPGTAALFHPVAFRIALAVLGGASHSVVASAAHLLTWELSVQSDPDNTPARPLFCDDPDSDLALSRAELSKGRVEVAGAEVDAQLIWYRGSALPAAVLTEVWDRHFPVRAPVVRWLRLLADDPRPQVWMRAAVAAGELCVRDFEHGYAELIRPLAEAATPRRRIFAATTLDQAAGHASHRGAVHKLVGDWSGYGAKSLRWTAAMALGYGNAAATTDDTLDALARIGIRDKGEQLAVASLNVVRLLALPDPAAVVRRMAAWTHHKQEAYQDLGLVTTVRLAATRVSEVLDDEPDAPLGGRGDWPLLLALAATRPELVRPMADLLWTALNTARSRDVAMDALEALLRTAVRKDGAEWTRQGLAALLPALAAEEPDRRRLDWLLRRMMNDPENPLPDAQARSLWWLAVPSRDRRGREERHG
ncbi:hypothetical protein [Streptomyces sp. NPDC056244]|uniref:hypothetical protein n=1 Tax=Streptomyces sp. NPDC056244 TaxID=3345762 RepID=UPI0035D8D498